MFLKKKFTFYKGREVDMDAYSVLVSIKEFVKSRLTERHLAVIFLSWTLNEHLQQQMKHTGSSNIDYKQQNPGRWWSVVSNYAELL